MCRRLPSLGHRAREKVAHGGPMWTNQNSFRFTRSISLAVTSGLSKSNSGPFITSQLTTQVGILPLIASLRFALPEKSSRKPARPSLSENGMSFSMSPSSPSRVHSSSILLWASSAVSVQPCVALRRASDLTSSTLEPVTMAP